MRYSQQFIAGFLGSFPVHDGPQNMYLVKIRMYAAKKLSSDMI